MSSSLVPVSIESIHIGQPLPFALKDASGTLLAHKGFVFQSREELLILVRRGFSLYTDVADSEAYQRAFVGKLHSLVREDKLLGQIAGVQISREDLEASRVDLVEGPPDWLDLQTQANAILRDSSSPHFLNRIDRLQLQLRQHAQRNPDGALFALFHLSASELHLYSATHAMLVCVMCGLAARDVLNWPAGPEQTLCRAALTMNISMIDLQDRLALQVEPPTPEQRQQIDQHAARSVQMLEQAGLADPAWLDAIRDHHSIAPGALASKSEGQRMARLIQRADMFAEIGRAHV